MERIDFERWAAIAVCAAASVLAVFLVFRYALPILFPFILGLAFGALARKLSRYIAKKSGKSQKFFGAVIYILILVGIFMGAFFAVNRLIGELLRLAESITQDGGEPFSGAVWQITDYITNLTDRLPIIRDIRAKTGNGEFWRDLDAALADAVKNAVTELGAAIPRLAAGIVSALPQAFVFCTVAVISGFFFAVGGVDLGAFSRLLPERARAGYENVKKRSFEAAIGWFRAYLLILGLTFFELFVGFSVLGVNYSFLAAIAVALVDLLPVFGVGTVLVPWAAIMLFTGNRAMGVGLLVLWATVSVVRQVAEPRIVGKSLGISPVITLLCMYGGLCLFGVPGMIAAPAVPVFFKAFVGQKE